MPPHGPQSTDFNLERAIELILSAHSKGELGQHIETLKNLAAELPNVSQDENRWKKFAVAAKREIYEISTTLLIKLLREATRK